MTYSRCETRHADSSTDDGATGHPEVRPSVVRPSARPSIRPSIRLRLRPFVRQLLRPLMQIKKIFDLENEGESDLAQHPHLCRSIENIKIYKRQ